MLSGVVVLAGGLIYLAKHGSSPVDYRTFRGEPSELRNLRGILRQVLVLQGQAVVQFGLLLLIATPVVRVAFSVWGFAEEGDNMYVAFTLIVLAVLLYSLLGAGSAF